MTARARIQQLTHTWYGFTVFAAVASVVQVALWPFTPGLLFSPMKLAFTFVRGGPSGSSCPILLNVFLRRDRPGHRLPARSHGLLARFLADPARARRALPHRRRVRRRADSALTLAWAGLTHFSLSTLVGAAVTAIAVTLYVRSFRLLTDPAIKAYVG